MVTLELTWAVLLFSSRVATTCSHHTHHVYYALFLGTTAKKATELNSCASKTHTPVLFHGQQPRYSADVTFLVGTGKVGTSIQLVSVILYIFVLIRNFLQSKSSLNVLVLLSLSNKVHTANNLNVV